MVSKINNIAINDSYTWRNFIISISKILNLEKSKIHIYCNTKESLEIYERNNKNKIFTSINLVPRIHKYQKTILTKKILNEVAEIEKKYNPIPWFSASDRLVGRGYATEAPYFPKKIKKVNFDYVKWFYWNLIKYWENKFKKKKIELFIYPLLVEATVGKKFGIKFRSFYHSKFESYYTWYTDEYLNNSSIKKSFLTLRKKNYNLTKIESFPSWHKALIKNYVKRTNLNELFIRIMKQIYKHFTNNQKNYSLISSLALEVRTFKNSRYLLKKLDDISSLNNKRFFFFPLQTEPEINLQGCSPEYYNQKNAIVTISQNLPSDCLLVVKEHFGGIGVRSKDFYNQLLYDLPNVKFIRFDTRGIDLIKKCLAVVTINSTAGLEAAIIGKPVINFGWHNYYSFLSNILLVKDYTDVRKAIFKITNNKIDIKKAIQDGSKLAEAIKTSSVSLEKFNFYNNQGFNKLDLKLIHKKLLKSFD